MKALKIGLLIISTCGLAHAARAADMAVKAPAPAVVQGWTWTGFYVGGHIGWAGSDADFATQPTGGWLAFPASIPFVVAATTRGLSADGFTGGGQLGVNYQINQFVFGIEGDFSFYEADAAFAGGPVPTTSIVSTFQDFEQKWFATIRGRLGVAFDRWLVYATGGVAFTDWRASIQMVDVTGSTAVFNGDGTRAGWVIGGGVELALSRNWSVKAEYLYADFGEISGTSFFPPPIVPGFTHDHSVDLVTQTVRLGVNYRF
jgi:outer membrane immunogenic protein